MNSEIVFFYTESLTNPTRAREVFASMRAMGADAVVFNVYEQDLSRWAKDFPRVQGLAGDAGLRRYVSPGRHGGVFSGALVVPSLYSYVHPESLIVSEASNGATTEAQSPMQGFWTRMTCVNDPGFRRYMREQLGEILAKLNPDGLLLDEPKGLTLACGCERCRSLRKSDETPQQANIRYQLDFLGEMCAQAKSHRGDLRTMLVVGGLDHENLLTELAKLPALDIAGASGYFVARSHGIDWLRTWAPQVVQRVRSAGKRVQIWMNNWGLPVSEHDNLLEAYRIVGDTRPDQICNFWYWRNSDDPERVMQITAEGLRAIRQSKGKEENNHEATKSRSGR